LYRGIFASDQTVLYDGLSQADIEYIMKKYKLIRPEDCPKQITKPTLLKNKYSDYEFDNIRINMPGAEKPHASKLGDELDFEKMKVNYDPDAKAATQVKKEDLQLRNYHKDGVLQEMVLKEQSMLRDTKSLNIFNSAGGEGDSFFNRAMRVTLPT
jgi:hypothetical protein